MTALSIFIDESGDTGTNSNFYIVTFVFHDQNNDISEHVSHLEQQLAYCNFSRSCAIHTGPIIRREEIYANMPVADRKRIFTRLFAFTRACKISYTSFNYSKKQFANYAKLKKQFTYDLSHFIDEQILFFNSFDRIIVYYDNGQAIITDTIGGVFAAKFFDIDLRKVLPSEYRLFQSADLICTLEMLRMKVNTHTLTASDIRFFGSESKLKKDYLKQLSKLRLKN